MSREFSQLDLGKGTLFKNGVIDQELQIGEGFLIAFFSITRLPNHFDLGIVGEVRLLPPPDSPITGPPDQADAATEHRTLRQREVQGQCFPARLPPRPSVHVECAHVSRGNPRPPSSSSTGVSN